MIEITKETMEKHGKNWEKMKNSISAYKEVSKRNIYLFDWLLFVFENAFLSCVDEKYKDSLSINKTRLTMIDTMIDDVADIPAGHSLNFLEEYLKILKNDGNVNYQEMNVNQVKRVKNTLVIWNEFMSDVRNYPRYTDFKTIFDFDLEQIANSMKYSFIINTNPKFNNIIENRAYGHHGMTVIAARMLDLMCAPHFDMNDFATAREIFYLSQQYARLGNLINTYEREIGEGDISNELITLLMEEKIIDGESVRNLTDSKYNEILKEKMDECYKYADQVYKQIEQLSPKIKSFDTNKMLKELKMVISLFSERPKYWLPEFKDKLFIGER